MGSLKNLTYGLVTRVVRNHVAAIGCQRGQLSARWRVATRPHGAARLRRQRGRNDAASRTLDVADGFRLPFSGMELGPFGSRAQCRGTARTPPGPGLVTSREVLERPNRYRTCPVHLDRTLHSVRCNTLGYTASASTDQTHNSVSGHYKSSVRSLKINDNHLLYSTNFTIAQMCQPPSVSPCARVLAYFHKYFQGCYHSTRSKCICNELEHLVAL